MQYMGWQRRHSADSSHSRHVVGILCWSSVNIVNFANWRLLASCCVWNYTAVKIQGLQKTLANEFLDFGILTRCFVTLSVPPTWRRGFVLQSVSPLHLVYILPSVFFSVHFIMQLTGCFPCDVSTLDLHDSLPWQPADEHSTCCLKSLGVYTDGAVICCRRVPLLAVRFLLSCSCKLFAPILYVWVSEQGLTSHRPQKGPPSFPDRWSYKYVQIRVSLCLLCLFI